MKNADDVTVAQKLYEKFVMLCANDRKLSVTFVKRPKVIRVSERGTTKIMMAPEVIVGYKSEDGGFTPLAALLTKRDIEEMCPMLEQGKKLAAVYREERKADRRSRPDEFGKTGRNPAFTNEAIDAMQLDA